ncbi:UNVERIFIED_CONTAM: hypothetical protein NCL1_52710 [Trichonephila clavipes]
MCHSFSDSPWKNYNWSKASKLLLMNSGEGKSGFVGTSMRAKHQTWLGGFAPETCQYPSMENILGNS